MSRTAALVGLLVLVASPGVTAQEVAAGHVASGHVFDDANRNGRREPGEQGIGGVAVSNGRDVVRSDGAGRYRLGIAAGDTVFVVKPAGWQVPRRADGLPATWHQQPLARPLPLRYGGLPAGTPAREVDFALQAVPADPGPLEVLVFADPQPKSARDVDYYARDIVAPLVGKHAAQLGLSLGDIVDDDLSLYPAVTAATTRLGVPWLHVPGNHDMDLDAAHDAESLHTFRRHFGPDTFAWEEAGAVFVVLDDVIHQPSLKPAYIGGFRASQFAFLQAYLAQAPKDRLLVIAVHIPLFEAAGRDTFRDADRERLFVLLRDFPAVLLLSAHNHAQQHWLHDARSGWTGSTPLHEYNVGAACGAFWSGVPDAGGIPDSTMADGTPNGHATLRVDAGGHYALAWHPARGGGDGVADGMRLHAPKVLRAGAYPAWGVHANVFMGRDDTRVEFRVDAGEWKPMAKVSRPDPWLLVENARDDAADALRGFDRSPEAQASPHLWRGALPTDAGVGSHVVEVRAFDAWRGELRAHAHYRLQPAD